MVNDLIDTNKKTVCYVSFISIDLADLSLVEDVAGVNRGDIL